MLIDFMDKGLAVLDELVSEDVLIKLKIKTSKAITVESNWHRSTDDENLVVFCPYYDNYFLEVAEQYVFDAVNELLGLDSIFYNYSNSRLQPGQGNFSSHIHVERYYNSGYLEGVGVMLLLDDFAEVNGATWFLLGSHQQQEKPEQTFFFQHAKRLIAPAGSIVLFHPNIWHAGGVNKSSASRDALTMSFCRPYMKQRLDYPRLLNDKLHEYSDAIKQKLGVYAQSPKSLEEFYSQAGGDWSKKREQHQQKK